MKAGKRGIELDSNDWYDILFWFEDEPEVFNFIEENEDVIKCYALQNCMTLKDTIDYLFKVRSELK